MSKQELFTIGRAAELAGVTRQSLQYYLMVGVVRPTFVSQTRRRMFDGEAIKQIKLVRKLNLSGYPLREIRELFLQRNGALKGR